MTLTPRQRAKVEQILARFPDTGLTSLKEAGAGVEPFPTPHSTPAINFTRPASSAADIADAQFQIRMENMS